MKKIDENFCGYIKVEDDTYTYNVLDNIVTLLPVQSNPQKRDDSLYRIKSYKTNTSEYLFGEDNNSMIAILRNGKFITDSIGTNGAIRFATPIIIKAFFVKLRNNKTHSGTVEWGKSAKIYAPLLAIVYNFIFKLMKYLQKSHFITSLV